MQANQPGQKTPLDGDKNAGIHQSDKDSPQQGNQPGKSAPQDDSQHGSQRSAQQQAASYKS